MRSGSPTLRARLKAAVAGLRAAGVEVTRVEIGNDNRIVVFASNADEVLSAPDDDLDRELREFEAGHGQG